MQLKLSLDDQWSEGGWTFSMQQLVKWSQQREEPKRFVPLVCFLLNAGNWWTLLQALWSTSWWHLTSDHSSLCKYPSSASETLSPTHALSEVTAIPSLFCGVRFPCLISLKYSLQLTFFYQFLCSFKYLLSLGESHIYVIRRGSSLEGHACNVILPNDNSSIWMSHKHFTLNMTNSKTIIFHSQFSPLLTSDQAHLRGIFLSLFFFLVYHWTICMHF